MMILQFLIEGGLLALCATLFGWIFLRKHPAARYTLLLAALFACLLLPMQMLLFKESGLALARVSVPVATNVVATPPNDRLKPALQPLIADTMLTAPQRIIPDGRLTATQPLIPSGRLQPSPQPPPRLDWPFILICIWATGALFGLLRFSVGWRRLVGIRQRSANSQGTLVQEVANDLRAHLGLRKFPEIVLSEEVATPLAFGWRKGAIILPSSLLHSLSKEHLRAAIAHEFAHLDQKHIVSLIVQRVSAALYWPNPLVHLACAELSKAREQVCDNFVLHLAPSTTFARTLLLVAQGQARHRPYPAAAGLLLPEWNLEQRVKGLIDPARRSEIHISRLNMTV